MQIAKQNIQRIRIAYIVALSAIVLVAVAGQLVIQGSLAEQQHNAQITNLAGRQRMISQRLSKNTVLISYGKPLHDQLATDLNDWRRSGERLYHGDLAIFVSDSSPKAIEELKRASDTLERAVRHCLGAGGFTPASVDAVLTAQAAYLPLMDNAVTDFSARADQSIESVQYVDFILFFALLVLVILEVLFVFRPLLSRAERHLVEKEAFLEQINRDARYVRAVTSARLGGWDWDLGSTALSWSPEVAALLGLPTAAPASWERLLGVVEPQARSVLEQRIDAMREEGGALMFEFVVVRPDGPRWMRIEGRLFDPQHIAGVLQDIDNVKLILNERERLLRANDDRLEAVTRGLAQASVMSSLHSLAAGIAHDFNNLLHVISACADELRELGAEAEPLNDIDISVAAGTELAGLLLTLKPGARTESFTTLDIAAVVLNTKPMLSRVLPPNIMLDFDVPKNFKATVLGDAGQLSQSLLNLAINARDAIGHRGRIQVSLREIRDGVEIVVKDDGAGMDDSVRQRVLEPFFTTKPLGSGTGLGLAMVHGVVLGHQGILNIESAPGHGTAIRIWLPTIEPPDVAQAEPPTSLEHATILLIDDEPKVLASTQRLLKRLGCQVVAVASGEEALELVRTESTVIDAVVCDVMMPGLGGPATVERLRALYGPTLPVVMISGYSDSPTQIAQPSAFLAKPVRGADLKNRLNDLLVRNNANHSPTP